MKKKSMLKKKGGGQHLKKKDKKGGHHRVLSTRTCANSLCSTFKNIDKKIKIKGFPLCCIVEEQALQCLFCALIFFHSPSGF
jgi:hypothetical protein